MPNSKASERSAILAILPPVAATTARTSAYVDMGKFGSGVVKVLTGANTATGAITLLRASSSTGANSQSVATAAYGGASTTNDDTAVVMNILQSDVDDDPSRPYYAFAFEAVALSAGLIEGVDPRYAPPTPGTAITIAR
jgi:hypothetical protein